MMGGIIVNSYWNSGKEWHGRDIHVFAWAPLGRGRPLSPLVANLRRGGSPDFGSPSARSPSQFDSATLRRSPRQTAGAPRVPGFVIERGWGATAWVWFTLLVRRS